MADFITNRPSALASGPQRTMAPVQVGDDLQRQNERLQVKIATVQAENRRLRRLTTNGRQGSILHRAMTDAKQIVGWRVAGYCVSRRQCVSYGMSERRWMWAMALLKLAGVIAMECTFADDFLVEDVAEIDSRLDRAVRKVEGNGLSLLKFRLPKNRVKR